MFFLKLACFVLLGRLVAVVERTDWKQILETNNRAGELAQWLRTLAAFEADLGSVPGTHEVAHNHRP